MNPIANVLLALCGNDMSIDLEVAKKNLPGVNECRIKAIARMLGICITESK